MYWVRPLKGLSGFATYNENDLEILFSEPISLEREEMDYLSNLWRVYQGADLSRIKKLKRKLLPKLSFIGDAIQAHLDRVPSEGSEGRPVVALKKLIVRYGRDNFDEIFKEFSKKEAIYGLGDTQVRMLMDTIVNERNK